MVSVDHGATQHVIGPAEILNESSSTSPACVSALDDKHVARKLLPAELQRWRDLTIIVCVSSIFLTFTMSVVSFVCWASVLSDSSSATFAIAFDDLLAILSSSTVIWRFCIVKPGEDYRSKERRACGVIAVCFIASAITVSASSLVSLINDTVPERPNATLILAIVNTSVYFLLFLAKFYLAEKLQSSALRADSIDAITGSATSFGVIVSTIIFEEDRKVWYIDASVALCIALITFIYGLQLLVRVVRTKVETELNSSEMMTEVN